MNKGLAALSSYADALSAVSSADYAGKDIGSLGTDVSSLLAKMPGVSTPAVNTVKALGGDTGPLASLKSALAQGYAAQEVAKVVAAADPSVQKILGILAAYLSAVGQQENQWEDESQTALNTADQLLAQRYAVTEKQADPPADLPSAKPTPTRKGRTLEEKRDPPIEPPPAVSSTAVERRSSESPLPVLQFFQVAERWTQRMTKTRGDVATLTDAIQKITQAEQALLKANGKANSPDLATVLGLV